MNIFQSMNMGLGAKKAPKPTHRGRKPSGKPGAQHLSAQTAAHGKGDFAGAKSAALNYANAIHKHMLGLGAAQTGGDETEPMDSGQEEMAEAQPPIVSAPKTTTPSGPSMAQRAMMKMGKK